MAESQAQRDFGCGGCTNRWTGFNRAHCASCHRTFNGVDLFDKHRRERPGATADADSIGYCKDPATITAQPRSVKGQPAPAKTATGERVMWETNGIWYSVPNPSNRGDALAAWRALQAVTPLPETTSDGDAT